VDNYKNLGELTMNWKIIFIGGLAFYAVQWIVSFATGPLIHDGVLLEMYKQNAGFWRPELNQDPPDMAALMPRWITVGLISTFIMSAIYARIRSAFDGDGWVKGAKFGFMVWVFSACLSAGWSGIFNLPEMIWVWWATEGLVIYVLGGIALGWVAQKLSPES